MGVLVGTSLIIIIPEGIEAIYSTGAEEHVHVKRSLRVRDGGLGIQWAPSGINTIVGRGEQRREASGTNALMVPGPVMPAKIEVKSPDTIMATSGSEEDTAPSTPAEDSPKQDEQEHHEEPPPTFSIGLSLITGFVLMFLIDKLPRHASEKLQQPPPTRHISLDNLSQGLLPSPIEDGEEESESFLQSLTPTPKQSRSLATTLGLVIHAAADGIAMGASATSSNIKLGFIIFLAIMIHKAPAAFGLTSVLLKQGLSKRAARGHLIIFSLAAPFGALSTWLLVHLLGAGGISGESGQWWTGMLLLFSGGTFLYVPLLVPPASNVADDTRYVAMHAMQEDLGHDHLISNGYVDGISLQRKQPKPQMRDTLAAVGGMLIPLLTQMGHHH
jgi:zinc transporter 9